METIILFAPLVGALICGFGWRLIGQEGATWTATGLLFLACLLSWIVFLGFDGEMERIQVMRWIEIGQPEHRLGDPARPADGDHADRHHHGLGARAPLLLGLHGP